MLQQLFTRDAEPQIGHDLAPDAVAVASATYDFILSSESCPLSRSALASVPGTAET